MTISAREIQSAGGLAEWMKKQGNKTRINAPRIDFNGEMMLAPQKTKKTKHGASVSEWRVSEHEEQKRLMEVCRAHEHIYPELVLIYATPNGGQRHVAVAAKLKAEGVKAGVPDLFLPAPRGNSHGLYIEMKAKGGSVTKAQRDMMSALLNQGYACIVAYGWEAAWKEIRAYLESREVLLWMPA